jgi:hypothetical protein
VIDVATRLVSVSAVAARSFIGYLDLGDSNEPFWRPPRTQAELGHVADNRPFRAAPENVGTGLEYLVRQRRDLPAGSFLFVLSDFLVPPTRTTWMHVVERRWDLVPVVVQDPLWDRSFPDVAGLVVPFVEPGTGEIVRVRLNEREVAALREQNELRLDELHRMFRSAGIEPVELTTDAPQEILAAFLAWADRRMYTRGRKP